MVPIGGARFAGNCDVDIGKQPTAFSPNSPEIISSGRRVLRYAIRPSMLLGTGGRGDAAEPMR